MPRKTYGGLSKDQLISFFTTCKKECKDAVIGIRKAQDKSLEQYMCRKDWGDKKKAWQSKRYVPIGKPTIKKAVRMIKKALIDAEDYFDFITYGFNEQKKKLCNVSKRVVKAHLNSDGFINKFSDAVESGFSLALMVLKFWVENVEKHWTIDVSTNELVTKTLPHLKVKVVNPYNFHFTADGMIEIEDEWIKLPQLKALSKSNGGPFDDKAIKLMMAGDYSSASLPKDDADRLERLGIRETSNKYRKDVLISHYWGPIIDKDNNVKMENAHFVIGNDKYILLEPQKNPFLHKKSPYVYGSPLPVLFRHIGKSLIEDVAGLEDAIVEFVNAQIDNLHWIMLGINEVDEMALSEVGKTELQELYPGKLIRKRSGYDKTAFNHVELGTSPEKAMPLLQELKLLYERETGVTEYVSSMPSSKQETLGEYQGKRGAAIDDFVSIAKDIETSFLVKCIDRARDLIIQYMSDFELYPDIATIFTEEDITLDELTPTQKKALIVTDLDIVGRGISVFFERLDRLNKLGSYVKFLNAMPEEAQIWPRWDEILKRINDAFAFDRREMMVRTPEEVQQIKRAQMQQAQQAMMQELQTQQKEWQVGIQKEVMKLQQDSEERSKDRMLKLLLAGMGE